MIISLIISTLKMLHQTMDESTQPCRPQCALKSIGNYPMCLVEFSLFFSFFLVSIDIKFFNCPADFIPLSTLT